MFSACGDSNDNVKPIEYQKYLSKVDSCSDCGATKFAISVVASSGGIYQPNAIGVSFKTSRISVICKSCGLIAKEYAEDPEELD